MTLAVPTGPLRLGSPLPLPPSVKLLADHLDAVLAMGEDLLALRLPLDRRAEGDPRPIGMHALAVQQRQVIEFVKAARILELGMTARLLQARKLALAFRRSQPSMKAVVDLFHGGTAVIEDADEVASAVVERFDTGEAAMAFLRTRAIIAADGPGLAGSDALAIGEDALLLGQISLGATMNVVARFLDALDAIFDLYPEAADSGLQLPAYEDSAAAIPLRHAPEISETEPPPQEPQPA